MGIFHNSEPFDGLFDLDNNGSLDFLEEAVKNEFLWDNDSGEAVRSEDDFGSDEWGA